HAGLALHGVQLAGDLVVGLLGRGSGLLELEHAELDRLQAVARDLHELGDQRFLERLGVHGQSRRPGHRAPWGAVSRSPTLLPQSALNRLMSSASRPASWVSSAAAPVACLLACVVWRVTSSISAIEATTCSVAVRCCCVARLITRAA